MLLTNAPDHTNLQITKVGNLPTPKLYSMGIVEGTRIKILERGNLYLVDVEGMIIATDRCNVEEIEVSIIPEND